MKTKRGGAACHASHVPASSPESRGQRVRCRALTLTLPAILAAILALTACSAPDDATPTPIPAATATAAPAAAPQGAAPTPIPTASAPTAAPTPTPTLALQGGAPVPAAPTATPAPSAAPSPTSPPDPGAELNAFLVAADDDYTEGLQSARISTRVWKTDFRFHTVPYEEIFSGGVPRDGIPPLYEPQSVSIAEADEWIEDVEPVIALELNGEARAYPLQVLTWHEIANDELGGAPVAVTFCPLCNSAVVFDRVFNGEVYEFGVSGNLRNSDLIMWDRQTESWWQQLTGEGIAGTLAGAQLDFIPAQIVSWAAFKDAHPNGDALSKETGYNRDYGRNPYAGYDRADSPPFLFLDPATGALAETDGRLLPKERIAAVEINGDAVAFPYALLRERRVVHHEVGGEPVVVFYEPGTSSALGGVRIATADDVGATGVFRPAAEGQSLTFGLDGVITDAETGSVWNVLGAATAGPLAGRRLERVNAHDHFWFAWAAFKPETRIYAGE